MLRISERMKLSLNVPCSNSLFLYGRLEWAGLVARLAERGGEYRVLVGET